MQPARLSGAPVHTIAGLELCASLDLPVFSEGCVTRAYTMAVALGMMHLEANTTPMNCEERLCQKVLHPQT